MATTHALASLDHGRIRSEQTRVLYRNCAIGVSSAAAVAIFVAIGVASRADPAIGRRALVWATLVCACAVGHMGLGWTYWRTNAGEGDWRRWLRWFTLFAFAEGMAWSLGAVWLTPADDFSMALVLVLAWTGVCSAGAIVFGPYPPTYLVFFYPAMLPHLWFALRDRYPMWELVVALELAYLVILPLIAWRFSAQLIESVRLRFANIDLADDLRVQKERAEAASRAKSTFLAAASHDLRQPIHALGLFVGALRAERMSRAARSLVDQIDGSVSAMDELFAALLDISKLDAGTVNPVCEDFALDPLLDRLVRDFAGEATAKGIAIRRVPTSLSVIADPLLLERIIGNLVSNAVRYTVSGKVVIGVRRRAQQVSIEVHDTGPGIPTELHGLIFQEFFQAGNPERDRSKGLGLGLAIVSRLAGLLDAPLRFRSAPGKGTSFTVAVPRGSGAAPRQAETPAAGPAPHALIAVIDDELAIRQAMVQLLENWGHSVITGGSSAALIAGAADTAVPDLIICDYRLREGETGVAVIAALRRHFGRPVTAMLITGDTAPDRIAEAQASGFLLLHKPLAAGKLRAAIGHLLRPQPPEART